MLNKRFSAENDEYNILEECRVEEKVDIGDEVTGELEDDLFILRVEASQILTVPSRLQETSRDPLESKVKCLMMSVCPRYSLRDRFVLKSQIRILRSFPAEAKYCPSGLKARANMVFQ